MCTLVMWNERRGWETMVDIAGIDYGLDREVGGDDVRLRLLHSAVTAALISPGTAAQLPLPFTCFSMEQKPQGYSLCLGIFCCAWP